MAKRASEDLTVNGVVHFKKKLKENITIQVFYGEHACQDTSIQCLAKILARNTCLTSDPSVWSAGLSTQFTYVIS